MNGMLFERLLIALRIKKASPRLAEPKPLPMYRGHIPPRPMPSPAPWQRSFEPKSAPSPGADSWEGKPDESV
jgi:hypothetical protein